MNGSVTFSTSICHLAVEKGEVFHSRMLAYITLWRNNSNLKQGLKEKAEHFMHLIKTTHLLITLLDNPPSRVTVQMHINYSFR